MDDTKVSIIIPIYGVEQFIERCAQSLMQQSLNEVEFIFVNDATPDNSMIILKEVLNKYPNRNYRIIEHQTNQGLPASRNTGLSFAKGEYIFHCDSDDFVEPSMLEDMYNTAKRNNADIVWCDWWLTHENGSRYMVQPNFTQPFDAVKSMLGGSMKFNVWNKLVKRDLYTAHVITFPSGYNMAEDLTMIMLFSKANKIVYLPKAYYHYVKYNNEAISKTYSEKHFKELEYNVYRIENYIKEQYGTSLDSEIAFLKLEAKFPLLLMESNRMLDKWDSMFSEANSMIPYNKYISFRNRAIQWLAWKKCKCLIKIYAFLFNKIIYGIIFS